MLDSLRRLLARPLVALWLAFSRHSWRRRVLPRDSPHVRAPGTNPDRVLIVGDGAAAGRGVLTHDLGLPGFLARSLTERTGRATDVDVLVDDEMDTVACVDALADVDLSQYDIVLLSIGAHEALKLLAPAEWEASVAALVGFVRQRTPSASLVFVLAVPQFGVNPHFPRRLADIVDFHVGLMNTITEDLATPRSGIVFVPESKGHVYETAEARVYERWADSIAERIHENLDPSRPAAADTSEADEQERQHAFEEVEAALQAADPDPVLDGLAADTRRALGTEFAAVTLVGRDTQSTMASSGIDLATVPRGQSLCDLTVRRSSHFAVEDASRDSRYAWYSMIAGEPGIRFYAGYPLESPTGQRIGALCVMDSKPRRFTPDDAAALRTLASKVQQRIYEVAS